MKNSVSYDKLINFIDSDFHSFSEDVKNQAKKMFFGPSRCNLCRYKE